MEPTVMLASSIAPAILIILAAVIAIRVGVLAVIYLIVPLFKGIGWLIMQIAVFIFSTIADVLRVVGAGVAIRATVTAFDRSGVEMEALAAVAAAALTVYDMCKAIDRGMVISEIRLDQKRGGKSGTWTRSAVRPAVRSPGSKPAKSR